MSVKMYVVCRTVRDHMSSDDDKQRTGRGTFQDHEDRQLSQFGNIDHVSGTRRKVCNIALNSEGSSDIAVDGFVDI